MLARLAEILHGLKHAAGDGVSCNMLETVLNAGTFLNKEGLT